MRSWPVGLALAALCAATPVVAQSANAPVPHSGRILGVFDQATGKPIAGADVIDIFSAGVAHTEAHGLVELSQFQQRHDSAVVRVRKLGYADTSFVVMVGAADTVPLEVDLHKAAVDLPALIALAATSPQLANPALADFNFRKKMGFGKFVDATELRKYVDNHSFVDFLTGRFPGMSIVTHRDGTVYLSSGRSSCSGPAFYCSGVSSECQIALYVDGVPEYVPGRTAVEPPDLRGFKSEDFVGVEWYASGASVPQQYTGTGAQCGVMLLWRQY